MSLRTHVVKFSKSLYILVGARVAELLGWKPGDELDITTDGKGVYIIPVKYAAQGNNRVDGVEPQGAPIKD